MTDPPVMDADRRARARAVVASYALDADDARLLCEILDLVDGQQRPPATRRRTVTPVRQPQRPALQERWKPLTAEVWLLADLLWCQPCERRLLAVMTPAGRRGYHCGRSCWQRPLSAKGLEGRVRCLFALQRPDLAGVQVSHRGEVL